ncbi:hypothetical protein LXL04_008459 [Taraxacum kok-saghyz]
MSAISILPRTHPTTSVISAQNRLEQQRPTEWDPPEVAGQREVNGVARESRVLGRRSSPTSRLYPFNFPKTSLLPLELISIARIDYQINREFAQTNNPNLDVIPCPCVLCTNCGHYSIKEVRYHLFAHGFDQNYKIWTFHGEKQTKLDSFQTHERCHSKPIPPDFYDTKDMLHDAFTYHYQHIKGEFGWSDAFFDVLLRAIKDTLPENNTMPSSLYEAKKLLKGVGLQYEKIHACPNDCVLFRKEHKDASECPTFRTSRWKKNTKNVPSKVLWYFPPIPRFRRMFSSSDIAHELTWHAEGQVNNGTLTHPRNSPSWKVVDNTWKEFGA